MGELQESGPGRVTGSRRLARRASSMRLPTGEADPAARCWARRQPRGGGGRVSVPCSCEVQQHTVLRDSRGISVWDLGGEEGGRRAERGKGRCPVCQSGGESLDTWPVSLCMPC